MYSKLSQEKKFFRSVSEKARSLMKENVSGQSECETCVCAWMHVRERDDSGESNYVSMRARAGEFACV